MASSMFQTGKESKNSSFITLLLVMMIPIFPTNQRKCAISSRSMAILTMLSTRLNTVLNRLIDSQRCKRHRRKRTREFHLHSLTIHINLAFKNIILKNLKLLQNDNETGRFFSQPPLISFKRDKNIGNFLVRIVLKSDDQPGTFKCGCKRCNTCPFIHDADKITGPKRSIKITDRFTCTSANVIYILHSMHFMQN